MRGTKLKLIGLCALLLCSADTLRAKEWRGIVPLKSTRADVEKLLGKPNQLGRYELENERVHFYYATGSCNKLESCVCFVPKDTVLGISVEPEAYVKLSDLKLERGKYEKNRGGHLPTIVTYSNDDEGVIYTVDDEDDEVMEITYVPTAEDCQNLIKERRAKKRQSPYLRHKRKCFENH